MTLLSLFGVSERLRYFLVLEKAQVNLYAAQQLLVSDPTLRRALGHFRDTEQGHVHDLEAVVARYGDKPSSLSWMANPLANVIGRLSSRLSLHTMLKMNMEIEQMAAREYRSLIADSHNPTLRDILWRHMIDEEMHRTWFEATMLNQLGTSR